MTWTRNRLIVLAVVLSVLALLAAPRYPRVQRLDAAPFPPDPTCLNPPPDTCTFYPNCLESRYHCGPTGYPLAYGLHFCSLFQSKRALLTSAGQAWMIATMHCLQLALVPDALGLPNATQTCGELEDKAFGTHAQCYVENGGICKLPPEDWLAVLDIVDITTLFDSWDAFKATLKTSGDCLEFYAFLIEHGL
ncbi:hypothetical protein FB45DRAFT_894387 [Roridomyces roridus]|uniref:Uncharacterized protein n=1 Tax=Roridomyces roridus TaxID=1738132 RepID=A0AAD7CG24_9AGAR|nr:hypothetical protein FB45DRAFT_894387 [Roridomyces roridus]